MSKDDETTRRFVADELREARNVSERNGGVFLADDEEMPDLESVDGAGLFLVFMLGRRDDLSVTAARTNARRWRKVAARYPRCGVYLQMFGYAKDHPRNIWEFPDAARYVRRWARFVGIRKPEDVANHKPAPSGFHCVVSLAACGVFSEALRQEALSAVKPAPRN